MTWEILWALILGFGLSAVVQATLRRVRCVPSLLAQQFQVVRKFGEKQGGQYMGGVHFEYLGGQIASGLSMISYLPSGKYRDRYFGVPIPATNVQPYQLEQTRNFARTLADRFAAQYV